MNRVTMLFQQSTSDNRVGGWSESWYRDGAVANTIAAAKSLARARSVLLGKDASIVGIRLQVIGGGSVSTPVEYPGVQRVNVDLPNLAALCRCSDATLVKRKPFMLRGVPDDDVISGSIQAAQGWRASFQTFARQLVADGWAFRSRSTNVAPVGIVSISNEGAFVLAAPLAFAAGDTLQLLRVRDTLGGSVVGSFRVATKTNDTSGTFNAWGGQVVAMSGSVRVSGFTYPAVGADTCVVVRAVTRKVGRPFGQFSGRRSRRR